MGAWGRARALGGRGNVYMWGGSNGANAVQILAANADAKDLPIAGISAGWGQLMATPPRSGPAPYDWNQPTPKAGQKVAGRPGDGRRVAQQAHHGDADRTIPYQGGPRFDSPVWVLMPEPDSDAARPPRPTPRCSCSCCRHIEERQAPGDGSPRTAKIALMPRRCLKLRSVYSAISARAPRRPRGALPSRPGAPHYSTLPAPRIRRRTFCIRRRKAHFRRRKSNFRRRKTTFPAPDLLYTTPPRRKWNAHPDHVSGAGFCQSGAGDRNSALDLWT